MAIVHRKEERYITRGDRPYEYLAKFGYTSDMKYKYLIVFFMFWLYGKKLSLEIFIKFVFPSLLVIKV
jgi:hypothetical protein